MCFYERELGRNDAIPEYIADGRNSKGMVRWSIAAENTAESEESARRLVVVDRLSALLFGVLRLIEVINLSW